MSKILEEILKVNKLIKSLINEEDVKAIQRALEEKNQLIQKYDSKENSKKKLELMQKINQLDRENIKNLDILMNKTKGTIDTIKNEKGKVKNNNSKVKKYNTLQSNSGYRFDRKK